MAEDKMKQINEAYNILSDDGKRKKYDEELKVKREQEKENLQENFSQGHSNNVHKDEDYNNISEAERRYRDMQRRRYEENLKKEQIKMQEKMQEQYQNAYYNYLRSLGYKIKEKWTWQKTKKLLLIITVMIIVLVVLWLIPTTRNIMINIYNSNIIIKIIVDIILGIFTAFFKSIGIFFKTLFA